VIAESQGEEEEEEKKEEREQEQELEEEDPDEEEGEEEVTLIEKTFLPEDGKLEQETPKDRQNTIPEMNASVVEACLSSVEKTVVSNGKAHSLENSPRGDGDTVPTGEI